MISDQQMLEDVQATIDELLAEQQDFLCHLDERRYFALLQELFLSEHRIITAIAASQELA